MKSIKELENKLDNISNSIIKKLEQAQRETAEAICDDVKSLAPSNTGKYRESIKVKETRIEGNKLKTSVTTDITVTAKSSGNTYNLGFLLETGTEMHAIPNAFGWGDIFGYESPQYKRTLQKDWHPGFESMPHFRPAMNKNKDLYTKNIKKVLDEEFKK